MPDVDQYSFTHKETAEALVKKAGLHTGKWQLVVTFGWGAANISPEQGLGVPTAFVGVMKLGLGKAKGDTPEDLVVDAAVVNPAPREARTSSSATAKRRRA